MAKPAARIAVIQAGFALGVLALLTRAVQLQIVEGEDWKSSRRAAGPSGGCCPRAGARSTIAMACRWP